MITIKEMLAEHWCEVAEIFEHGIKTKNATFETTSPESETWNKDHRADCRLVAKDSEKVIGWAALSNVSGRCIYAGVCEVSIYVHPRYGGRGIGKLLMVELIKKSEENNIWTLQAGIFPENKVSIKLHEKGGFRIVGKREKIGKMDNIWRDIILLERRSSKIGIQ